METDGAGNPLHYYVHGLGLISRVNPDGTTRYYRWNNVGSIVAMTDEIGDVTHSYSYDPYGNVLASDEEDFNPYRFVGRWGVMDEDNGLYFMRARYYDPETGRFISEDPVWNVNLYAYAGSNPLLNIDPEGRAWYSGIISGAQELLDIIAVLLWSKEVNDPNAEDVELPGLIPVETSKVFLPPLGDLNVTTVTYQIDTQSRWEGYWTNYGWDPSGFEVNTDDWDPSEVKITADDWRAFLGDWRTW